MYRIREVDGADEVVAEALAGLHRSTFLDSAPVPAFEQGYWWLAFHGIAAVAFAGVVPSTHVRHAGYFCRVGVLDSHCGQGLQLRLMRAGWRSIVSDTTGNVISANNFIRAGYRLFEPAQPWAWANSLYWRRDTIR
jgi:hypothetical protein